MNALSALLPYQGKLHNESVPCPTVPDVLLSLSGTAQASKAAISGLNHSLPLHFHDKKYLCFCLFKLQFEEIRLYVIKECSSLEWVLPLDN